MSQMERRKYLIHYLLKESEEYKIIAIPEDEAGQKKLLRALFNVRMPKLVTDEFLQVQDEYLQIENESKGIVDYKSLTPVQEGIYLWQGDAASVRYSNYVHEHKNGRALYLELGVGANTPRIIKYPFWRLTAADPKAVYVCINNGEAVCPQEIENQSICINGDIGEVLRN